MLVRRTQFEHLNRPFKINYCWSLTFVCLLYPDSGLISALTFFQMINCRKITLRGIKLPIKAEQKFNCWKLKMFGRNIVFFLVC